MEQQPQPNVNCKLLEVSLKVLYKAWKSAQKIPEQKVLDAVFTQKVFSGMMKIDQLYPKNDIFKAQVIKLKTLGARWFLLHNTDNLAITEKMMTFVSKTIFDHSYMSHKEQVRVVSAQSLASLIPHMALNDTVFFKSEKLMESYVFLIMAMVYLLTDENPQIRLFIQSQNVQHMLGMSQTMATPYFSQRQCGDVNDIVLIRNIFRRVTDRVKQGEWPEGINHSVAMETFAEGFLTAFIANIPYREHMHLNFDEKIFFHEPVNKFFDLPWLRVLAYEQLRRLRNDMNPFERDSLEQISLENTTIGELHRCYSTCNELRRTSHDFESLLLKVILTVGSGQCTQVFWDFIRSKDNNIEHLIKYVVSL